MKENKSILIITPEMVPFAKTGGLADMVAAFCECLKKQGHEVKVILPYYKQQIQQHAPGIKTFFDSMCVTMGIGEEWCAVRFITTDSGIPVYFIEHDLFFNRPGLYHDEFYNDYFDNAKRFGFFCRAALQLAIDASFDPDIVHVHDWQTALVAAYMKTWFWNNSHLSSAASVLTIHNSSYQGQYDASVYQWLGLHPDHFASDIFEDYGKINILKGGIYYADIVNTVSPNHAKEICTPFGGFGLAPYVSNKGDAFCGILNGVDYTLWSPENDPYIPARYSDADLGGKRLCKQRVQNVFHLEPNDSCALFGCIGRFAVQKGFHLIREIVEKVISNMAVQIVILGSGDPDLEHYFRTLPQRYPGKAGSFIGFDNQRAHLIEAGADFFLMPSLYEPCGLNQLYSLRYGTLPVVRGTGGLADTIENYNETTGEGTGFIFYDDTPSALYYTIGWAVSTYYDRQHHMQQLIRRAMQKDFSWDRSARDYLALYDKAVEKKKAYDSQWITHRL